MEKRRRFKGSAVVSDLGEFLFTPYNIGGGQKMLKTLVAVANGVLAYTKTHYVVCIKLPRVSKFSVVEVAKIAIALLTASRAAGHDI